MEQKTAQFLVLFNHFYPLASKNHKKLLRLFELNP